MEGNKIHEMPNASLKKPLGIYVHLPFCIRKCNYCDFLSGPVDRGTIDRYMEALLLEIEASREHGNRFYVDTIFFGGGTPSIVPPEKIAAVMEKLREIFGFDENPEITIEANPGTLTEEKLKAYREAGINRLSIGLQSTEDDELKVLGRIHTYAEFLESFRTARRCGFTNINIDLMSALPGQTAESWAEALEKIAGLNPEHISAYSLIIEEGTPFYAWFYEEKRKNLPALPSEEEERGMYGMTGEILKNHGYFRYEISNYAKAGFACRHNMGYWRRKDYLGIGVGAASLIDNMRFRNRDDIEYYIEHSSVPDSIQEERAKLTEREQMEEFMFLGLRTMEGISEKEFDRIFTKKFRDVYGETCIELGKKGLLEEGSRIRLTEKGIDLSNYVLAQFLISDEM